MAIRRQPRWLIGFVLIAALVVVAAALTATLPGRDERSTGVGTDPATLERRALTAALQRIVAESARPVAANRGSRADARRQRAYDIANHAAACRRLRVRGAARADDGGPARRRRRSPDNDTPAGRLGLAGIAGRQRQSAAPSLGRWPRLGIRLGAARRCRRSRRRGGASGTGRSSFRARRKPRAR